MDKFAAAVLVALAGVAVTLQGCEDVQNAALKGVIHAHPETCTMLHEQVDKHTGDVAEHVAGKLATQLAQTGVAPSAEDCQKAMDVDLSNAEFKAVEEAERSEEEAGKKEDAAQKDEYMLQKAVGVVAGGVGKEMCENPQFKAMIAEAVQLHASSNGTSAADDLIKEQVAACLPMVFEKRLEEFCPANYTSAEAEATGGCKMYATAGAMPPAAALEAFSLPTTKALSARSVSANISVVLFGFCILSAASVALGAVQFFQRRQQPAAAQNDGSPLLIEEGSSNGVALDELGEADSSEQPE